MIIDLTEDIDNINLISKEEFEIFRKLYYLYEYSDEINVLSVNPVYPSLFNYVKTGILTEKEMLEVLQCE